LTVDPPRGQINTVVTLRGSNLLGGGARLVRATLGGVAADIRNASDTEVVLRAADGASAVDETVELTADTGALVTRPGVFTYLQNGLIESVDPSTGQAGALVTLRGLRLLAGASAVQRVTLAGIPADDVVFENDTVVVVVAGASPVAIPGGPVVLEAVTEATVFGDLGVSFAYAAPAAIDALEPADGVAGTVVTIRGTSLLNGGRDVQAVFLADQAVEAILNVSDTAVVVRAGQPTNAFVGTGDVVIENVDGALATRVDGFTYLAAGQIVAVEPAVGQFKTTVVIRVTNLLGGSDELDRVELAGVQAELIVANNTHVEVRAGASQTATGAGAVRLVNKEGAEVALAGSFAYLEPGVVTLVAPPSGQLGTRITLTGSRLFGGGTTLRLVTLAGVPVLDVLSVEDAQMVVRAGASLPLTNGTVVIESDSGAQVVLEDAFSYDRPSNITGVFTTCPEDTVPL
jgi:hypothetical protein